MAQEKKPESDLDLDLDKVERIANLMQQFHPLFKSMEQDFDAAMKAAPASVAKMDAIFDELDGNNNEADAKVSLQAK